MRSGVWTSHVQTSGARLGCESACRRAAKWKTKQTLIPLRVMLRGSSNKAMAFKESPEEPSCTPPQEDHLPLHKAPADTLGYRLPLFLGYTAIGVAFTYLPASKIDVNVALALTSTLWLGFVLGMSLTEAWVKFKAPFLNRHVAVDVGRHVFPALNSLEAAMAVTIGVELYRFQGAHAINASAVLPALLTVLLVLQMAWLTPALSLRAQHLIASSADPADLTPRQLAALAGIQEHCARHAAPPPALHAVYGVVELSKVALLVVFIWQLVGGEGGEQASS